MKPEFAVAVLAIVLSALPNPSVADDTVAKLAAEAAREYDILAPSVQATAETLIEEVNRFRIAHKAPPAFDWNTEARMHKVFATPRGELVSIPTVFRYRMSVRQYDYQYAVHRIRKIVRTGIRQRPFAATVEFDVDTFIQTAETTVDAANNEIPNGYRAVESPEPLNVAPQVSKELDAECWGLATKFPLPYGPTSGRILESAPKALTKAAKELLRQCAKAKPIKNQATMNVTFYYRLDENAWYWRTEGMQGDQ